MELLSGAIVDHELNVKNLEDKLEKVEGEKLEVRSCACTPARMCPCVCVCVTVEGQKLHASRVLQSSVLCTP